MADAKSTKTSDRTLKNKAAITVDNNLKAGAKPMAQGVGESKRFGGGGEEKDLSQCTVNGEPLPKECWPTFPYSLTDQGRAEAKKLQDELSRTLPSVYKGRDRTSMERVMDPDKKLRKFADDRLANEIDTNGLVLARDAFQPIIERHTPKGHRGMMMSTRKCQQEGLIRAGVEYTKVLVKNEETGAMEPVTCGGMFLASAPEHLVEKSQRYHRSLGGDQQKHVVEKVQDQARQVMRDSGMQDFAQRRGITDTLVGLEEENQERGDAELLRDALAHE